eukprot:Awhi_evm1s8859
MTEVKATFLVTGGCGYVGSACVLDLLSQGYEVIILDNFSAKTNYDFRKILRETENVKETKGRVIEGDISDAQLLSDIFSNHKIAGVFHFAASTIVSESVTDPAIYYKNNVSGTLCLLESMREFKIPTIVFSSTCAIYGKPTIVPIPEDHGKAPISPYGSSKLMMETMLQDFSHAYGIRSIAFRYFNAAGAHPTINIGEDHDPETHLIPITMQAALKIRDKLKIYGNDYDTADGTCIRDYIHICDLSTAHILGMEYLLKGGETNQFNLGSGDGYSVKEIFRAVEKVTGLEVPHEVCERRPGDPPILIGNFEKANRILGWSPKYSLTDIITHAYRWHKYNLSQK